MFLSLPSVVPAATCAAICEQLSRASFEDGVSTGGSADQRIKNNVQLSPRDPLAQSISRQLGEALREHTLFRSAAWPRRMTQPRVSRYDAGMYYREHLDNAFMGGEAAPLRTDMALTIALNDAAYYEGGELVAATDSGEQRWRGSAGDVVVYSAGCLHAVEEVTAGSRLVAVAWIESQVRDAGQRQALFELDCALDALDREGVERDTRQKLARLRGRLMRMWCEP